MKRLTLTRNKGWYARFRALKLEVDGEPVGTIRAGRTVEITVPDDAQELVGRMDWAQTEPLQLWSVADGARIDVTGWLPARTDDQMGLHGLPMAFTVRESDAAP